MKREKELCDVEPTQLGIYMPPRTRVLPWLELRAKDGVKTLGEGGSWLQGKCQQPQDEKILLGLQSIQCRTVSAAQ